MTQKPKVEKRGRKKGCLSWNKGKTGIYSQETIEKIRKGVTGLKQSQETIEKRRKKLMGHPSWGLKKGETNSGSFKKGHIPWTKGKKLRIENYAEYQKIHRWVKNVKGSPKICEHCNKVGKMDWANKSQRYLKRENDWIPLCRKCHTSYDMQFMKKIYV